MKKKIIAIAIGIFALLILIINIPRFVINRGVRQYNSGDYASAADSFNTASSVSLIRRCEIRVNHAMARLHQLGKLEGEVPTETINEITAIRDSLYNDNCAHPDDNNGKNERAEELERQLNEFLNMLSSASKPSSGSESEQNEGDNSEEEQQLEERREEASAEREEQENFNNSFQNHNYTGADNNW